MDNLIPKVEQKLFQKLTIANIEKALEILNSKKKQKFVKGDKNYWYFLSYPVILRRFSETKDIDLHEKWVERIALIFSWIPGIPYGGFNEEAIRKLFLLEQNYYDVKLESTSVTKYEDSVKKKQGELTFRIDGKPKMETLDIYIKAADGLLNFGGRWNFTLATTTKLLHFMCPSLFPIYDSNINAIIFGGQPSYSKYYGYIFALQRYLQKSETRPILEELARRECVSLVRLVDLILFNLE